MAVRLAGRMLRGDFILSSEASSAPQISVAGDHGPPYGRGRTGPRPRLPRHIASLEKPFPPPDILEKIQDDEREELNRLHLLAGEAVDACAFL